MVLSVLLRRVLGNRFLLSDMTRLLRTEAKGQSRTKQATVASGFKSQPLPSLAPLLKVGHPILPSESVF